MCYNCAMMICLKQCISDKCSTGKSGAQNLSTERLGYGTRWSRSSVYGAEMVLREKDQAVTKKQLLKLLPRGMSWKFHGGRCPRMQSVS